MSTNLYWFSGTGNSLAAARKLAAAIGARPIPLASTESLTRVRADADQVVVVFPCYLQALVGYPVILERFFGKLEGLDGKRLHAVCTCGGHELVNALPALRKLDRFVRSRGGRLRGMHSVRLPMNNLDYEHIPFPIDADQATMHRRGAAKLGRIARRISRDRPEALQTLKGLLFRLMEPLFRLMEEPILASVRGFARVAPDSPLPVRELLAASDAGITVDDACTGCGICARVCPVASIELADGRPTWRHRCEMCFACDEWCPQAAIHHWSRAPGIKYHHPDVALKDFLDQAKV